MAITTFATYTSAIPLTLLDANFATAATLGNASVTLGATTSSVGNLTLTNVTVSSGNLSSGVIITLPTITDFIETAPASVNSSTAQTISLTSGTVLRYTLTGNCTFTMPTATAGKSFIVMLTQDATGARTATFTSVKWPGGTAPTITTTASTGFDIISFVSNGTNWYGNAVQAFA